MKSIIWIRKALIFIAICMIGVISFCSKKTKDYDWSKYENNQSITDEEALYGICRELFKDSLKSFKTEKNSLGKQEVTIEYGSNKAYTFYSEGNYSERIQFETVRYILLFFHFSKKRNISNLRISVVKPFFVTEIEIKKEVIEEFEVFRTSVSLEEIEKITDWDNLNLLKDNRSFNSNKTFELFNQVRLRWKIELNELNRIELR